jgi:hypothetical protein
LLSSPGLALGTFDMPQVSFANALLALTVERLLDLQGMPWNSEDQCRRQVLNLLERLERVELKASTCYHFRECSDLRVAEFKLERNLVDLCWWTQCLLTMPSVVGQWDGDWSLESAMDEELEQYERCSQRIEADIVALGRMRHEILAEEKRLVALGKILGFLRRRVNSYPVYLTTHTLSDMIVQLTLFEGEVPETL